MVGLVLMWDKQPNPETQCEKERKEEEKKEKKREPRPRNPVKRNGKKKCNQTQKPNVKRKKKIKKKKTSVKGKLTEPSEQKKKKVKSCSRCSDSGSFRVCLITKMLLEIENTSNVFSVSITHHSKIEKLSDGNKNWKQKPNRLLSRRSYHFLVIGDENRVISDENNKSKQPIRARLITLF